MCWEDHSLEDPEGPSHTGWTAAAGRTGRSPPRWPWSRAVAELCFRSPLYAGPAVSGGPFLCSPPPPFTAAFSSFPGKWAVGPTVFREGLGKLSLFARRRAFPPLCHWARAAMGSVWPHLFISPSPAVISAIGGVARYLYRRRRPRWAHQRTSLGLRWAYRSNRLVFGRRVHAFRRWGSIAWLFWAWADLSTEAGRIFYPPPSFYLGLSHAGVRLGRKTTSWTWPMATSAPTMWP